MLQVVEHYFRFWATGALQELNLLMVVVVGGGPAQAGLDSIR